MENVEFCTSGATVRPMACMLHYFSMVSFLFIIWLHALD